MPNLRDVFSEEAEKARTRKRIKEKHENRLEIWQHLRRKRWLKISEYSTITNQSEAVRLALKNILRDIRDLAKYGLNFGAIWSGDDHCLESVSRVDINLPLLISRLKEAGFGVKLMCRHCRQAGADGELSVTVEEYDIIDHCGENCSPYVYISW